MGTQIFMIVMIFADKKPLKKYFVSTIQVKHNPLNITNTAILFFHKNHN